MAVCSHNYSSNLLSAFPWLVDCQCVESSYFFCSRPQGLRERGAEWSDNDNEDSLEDNTSPTAGDM